MGKFRTTVRRGAHLRGHVGMNPPKFDACIEAIDRYLSDRDEVETALVYGSVALGTAAEESDLDLLLMAPRRRHGTLARNLYRIGERHDVTVSPYLVPQSEIEGLDPQFQESVARDGIVLKGKPLDPTVRRLALRPYELVTLHLDHLPQRAKVALSRELYGYRSTRRYKGKTYASRKPGFVEMAGGRKLGRGTFLVPSRAWPGLEDLLRRRGGKRWAFTVWIQSG